MSRENGLDRFLTHREELNQRYKSNRYRHLKYTALGFFIADIVLLAAMTIFMDSLSMWWLLFLRGCAGVIALIGVIIYIVYVYRINRDFEREKYTRRKDND